MWLAILTDVMVRNIKFTSSVLMYQVFHNVKNKLELIIASVCECRLFILRLSQLLQLCFIQLECTENYTIWIDPSLELEAQVMQNLSGLYAGQSHKKPWRQCKTGLICLEKS